MRLSIVDTSQMTEGRTAVEAPAATTELAVLDDRLGSVGDWPRSIPAVPGRLRELLEAMAAEVGADEVVLQDLIADPADRRNSYRLIAEAFELPARGGGEAAG